MLHRTTIRQGHVTIINLLELSVSVATTFQVEGVAVVVVQNQRVVAMVVEVEVVAAEGPSP
jgi:hypothetical protein